MNNIMEFRFSFHTMKYAETVKFYRDSLKFPVVHTWNRGFNDSGYLFQAASGLIVVLQSATKQIEPLKEAVILIQVEDLDLYYRELVEQKITITQEIIKREWGHRDFKISDPNGLVLGFYSEK